MATKIIKLYYNGEVGWNKSIEEVWDFFQIQQPLEDWILAKDDEGITNGNKIIQKYDVNTAVRLSYLIEDENGEIESNDSKDKDGKDLVGTEPMPWPIQLHVAASLITRDLLLDQSNFVSTGSSASNFRPRNRKKKGSTAFDADTDARIGLLNSSSAVFDTPITALYQKNTERPYDSAPEGEFASKERPLMTVWVWSKSFNEQRWSSTGNKKPFNKNSLFNLTPFLQSLNTNVVKSGGSFSMTLAPVIGKINCGVDKQGNIDAGGTWYIDREHYMSWKENEVKNFLFKSPINHPSNFEDSDFSEGSYNKGFQSTKFDNEIRTRDNFNPADIAEKGEGDWLRSDFFFTNVLSENDVVFISLSQDIQPEEGYVDDFFLSVDNIKGKDWTMFGLIDSNSTSLNAEATDVSINIAGRDLMKLLIEDGSFFFQKSYANPDQKDTAFNNKDLPKQGDEVNSLNKVVDKENVSGVNRLITTGMIETLFNQESRNVGFVMNLLISQLANIEICPSGVFEHYGDDRTKFQVEVLEQQEENVDGENNEEKK